MYAPHKNFDTPALTQKIWRYLDFTKLVAMLESNCLFFPSISTLEDKFEGAYTNNVFPVIPNLVPVPANEIPTKLQDAITLAQEMDKAHRHNARNFRPLMYVNCWHMNNHESAAMWKTYLKSNEGVAIASTIQSLTKCFKNPEAVYVGKVHYLDYNADVIGHDNFLRPVVCKRKSFEYENEVRAVVWDGDRYKSLLDGKMLDTATGNWKPEVTFEPGRDIAVDVDILVEEIYVAPTSPQWFHKLIEATLKTYGLERTVKQSSLAEDPVW